MIYHETEHGTLYCVDSDGEEDFEPDDLEMYEKEV